MPLSSMIASKTSFAPFSVSSVVLGRATEIESSTNAAMMS